MPAICTACSFLVLHCCHCTTPASYRLLSPALHWVLILWVSACLPGCHWVTAALLPGHYAGFCLRLHLHSCHITLLFLYLFFYMPATYFCRFLHCVLPHNTVSAIPWEHVFCHILFSWGWEGSTTTHSSPAFCVRFLHSWDSGNPGRSLHCILWGLTYHHSFSAILCPGRRERGSFRPTCLSCHSFWGFHTSCLSLSSISCLTTTFSPLGCYVLLTSFTLHFTGSHVSHLVSLHSLFFFSGLPLLSGSLSSFLGGWPQVPAVLGLLFLSSAFSCILTLPGSCHCLQIWVLRFPGLSLSSLGLGGHTCPVPPNRFLWNFNHSLGGVPGGRRRILYSGSFTWIFTCTSATGFPASHCLSGFSPCSLCHLC